MPFLADHILLVCWLCWFLFPWILEICKPSCSQTLGSNIPSQPPELLLNDEGELILSPAQVLNHHSRLPTAKLQLELLTQWVGQPLEEASWENYDLLATQFPDFRLENKSFFQEGCTEKPRIFHI